MMTVMRWFRTRRDALGSRTGRAALRVYKQRADQNQRQELEAASHSS
jgi:hypothetical protein